MEECSGQKISLIFLKMEVLQQDELKISVKYIQLYWCGLDSTLSAVPLCEAHNFVTATVTP
jgi:hypothetical protein